MSSQDSATVVPLRFQASAIASPPSNDASILIFGASGDLTARKLIPAVFMLQRKEYLPANVPIIGVARREKSHEAFRAEMKESLSKHIRGGITEAEWEAFSRRLFYVCSHLDEGADFTPLRQSVEQIEQQQGVAGTRVIYLATDPSSPPPQPRCRTSRRAPGWDW